MLGQSRRRWVNIVPTFSERLVFAGIDYLFYTIENKAECKKQWELCLYVDYILED